MKKPTAMLLDANFDINQTGETLEWTFSRKDGDGNPVKGRYAGEIYFTVGEVMRVRVRAGSTGALHSFEVLDCCLITRPQIVMVAPGIPAQYANPSPFIDNEYITIKGASVNIPADEFVVTDGKDKDPTYKTIEQKWKNHLTVGETVGRWEFSLVLTVLISRTEGVFEKRVFVFDPEGEVGAGLSPTLVSDFSGDGDVVAAMLAPEGEVGGGLSPT